MITRWRLTCLRLDGSAGLSFWFRRRSQLELVMAALTCSCIVEAYEVAL